MYLVHPPQLLGHHFHAFRAALASIPEVFGIFAGLRKASWREDAEAGSELAVECFSDVQEIAHILPAWEKLAAECSQASVFSTWRWLGAWWQAFGEGVELRITGVFDGDYQLVGLAPLAIKKRRAGPVTLRVLHLLGDGSSDSDNLDILALPGYEHEVAMRLADWLRNSNDWDVLELNTVPVSSQTVARLSRLLEARTYSWARSIPGCAVPLPPTWKEYLEGISSKERYKVGSRARKLEAKYNVKIRKAERAEDIDRDLEILYDLHAKRWGIRGEEGSFADRRRRALYSQISRTFLAEGRLHFWIMELNDVPVAAQFGFRFGNTVYSLQEGFDPAYNADSVGYVLRSHVLKTIIGEGAQLYDFLAGINDSKLRWGGVQTEYRLLSYARRFSTGSAYLHVERTMYNSKDKLKAMLPAAIYTILKGAMMAMGLSQE